MFTAETLESLVIDNGEILTASLAWLRDVGLLRFARAEIALLRAILATDRLQFRTLVLFGAHLASKRDTRACSTRLADTPALFRACLITAETVRNREWFKADNTRLRD